MDDYETQAPCEIGVFKQIVSTQLILYMHEINFRISSNNREINKCNGLDQQTVGPLASRLATLRSTRMGFFVD